MRNKVVSEKDNGDYMPSRSVLSLDESKTILTKKGLNYSSEEVLIIRDFMYCIAEIVAKHYQRKEEADTTIITITKINKDESKSIPIHPRKYRRAS